MFIEFVSFTNDDAGNPIYENTMQYAILRREWMPGGERSVRAAEEGDVHGAAQGEAD